MACHARVAALHRGRIGKTGAVKSGEVLVHLALCHSCRRPPQWSANCEGKEEHTLALRWPCASEDCV